MKKNFFIFASLLVTLSVSTLFAQFQGTLEIKETDYNKPASEKDLQQPIKNSGTSELTTNSFKMMFLGSNVRMEQPSDESESPDIVIIKSNEKKIIVLMPEKKQYMEFDFQVLIDLANGIQGLVSAFSDENKSSTESKSKFTKTGKTTTLNGYKCEEYVRNSKESISTTWICENFTTSWKMFKEVFTAFDKMGSNGSNSWFITSMDLNGFPFKATEKGKDGKLISEWEVVNVNKSKPNNSLFEIPKGYEKINLNNLF